MYSPVMAVIKSLDGTEEYEREGIISGKITHGCMGSTFCIGNSFSHMLELEVEYSPMYVKGMTFRFDLIENYATSHELLYKHNFIIESAKRNLDRVTIVAYGVFNVPVMNTLFNWEWCPSSATGDIPSFGEVLQAISDHIGVVFQGTAGENLCETLAGVKLPYRNCAMGYENDGSKYTIRQMIEYIAGAFGCNATEMESIDGSGISGIILGNYIGIPFPGKYGAFTFDKEVYSDGNQGYYSLDGSILGDNDFFDRIEVRTTSGDSINRSTDVISERTISMGSSEQEARYTLQLENPFIDSARLNYVFSLLTSFENTGGRFFAHSGSLKYAGNIMLDDYDSVMCEVGGSITCGPVMQVVTTFDGGLSHEVTITGPESIQSSSGSGGSSVIVGGNGTMNQVIVQINKNNEANQQFHNVTTEKLIVMGEAIAKSITTDNLSAKVAEIDSLEADSAIIQNIFSESIISDKAILDVLQAKVVDANVVKAAVAEVGYLTADEANLVYATINSLEAEKTRISVLEADNATINGKLSAIEVEVEGKLNANDLSAEVAKLGYATADNLNATNAKIEDLDVNKLSVADAKVQYAEIDFSNVGTQVVSTSMIKDGAVTNEKVGNLSANKITSGTIDASKITVTNLNADNLTVGTINGQRIGKGSLSLDKLSEEVPTKEYLDNVQKELQGQIDGAIETFTKSEIPTLNNEPANAWTDNETRKKHIGDVCYVLNPASSANGYCYRFANTGTESSPSYEWVLIKDSDVTKALQDIIDINGEITGIKQFDTEISSWKTDTDDELSSLKLRTTTLETDMGSKVESSVFNELKQTVDENSSSITSLSTTVSKKADSSTVETLTNTVNSVKQTADKNTLSISGMQTEIGKKADGSTVTELSTRTSNLEQNLDGFKTEVSKTYTTKTDFDNLEIGGRNLLLNSSMIGEQLKCDAIVGCNSLSYIGYEDSGLHIITPGDSGNGNNGIGFVFNDFTTLGIVPGNTITFSLLIKGTSDNNIPTIRLVFQNEGNTWYDAGSITSDRTCITPTDKFQRAYVTYTIPTSATFTSKRMWLLVHGNMGSDLYIKNLKLELGNKATDWTPAPEDTEEKITELNTKYTEVKQTADGLSTTVASHTTQLANAETKIAYNETVATQTAEKFSWLVKSGTSSTDFTLTDRVASLLSEEFNIDALTTFKNSAENGTSTVINGGSIKTNTITADKLNVDEIFSKSAVLEKIFAGSITATGTITGGSFVGSSFEGATGSFDGEITASSGKIGFLNIGSTYLRSGTSESKSAFYMKSSALQIATFANGYRDKYTLIQPTGIYTTGDVQGSGTSLSYEHENSVRSTILNIGDITINSNSPFGMNIANQVDDNQTILGVCLLNCWPHSTWAFACTPILNGTNLYISTTTTQVYTVSVVIFYKDN